MGLPVPGNAVQPDIDSVWLPVDLHGAHDPHRRHFGQRLRIAYIRAGRRQHVPIARECA